MRGVPERGMEPPQRFQAKKKSNKHRNFSVIMREKRKDSVLEITGS